jgi:RimJ/RimL family protein N-acetyltransferase
LQDIKIGTLTINVKKYVQGESVMKTEAVRLKESMIADRIRAYEWLYFSDFSPCPSTVRRSGAMGKPTLDEFTTDFSDHFFTGEAPEKGRAFIIVLDRTGEEIGFISYDSRNLNESAAELDVWMKSSSYTRQGFGPAAIRQLSDELFKKGFKNLILRSSSESDVLAKAFSKAGFSKVDSPASFYKKTDSKEKSSDRSYYMILSKS